VRGVALHVFEVEEVLSSLRHLSQVWQQIQQLVEFVLQQKRCKIAIFFILCYSIITGTLW
jgi:hypothetical protein